MAKKNRPLVVLQEQESWLHVEDLVRNTVVQVFAHIVVFDWLEPYKQEDEYEQRATGFFINDAGDIVTTAHVVDQAKRVWIQIPALGHKIIHVEVFGFAPDRDIALLRISDADRAMLKKELGTIPFLPCGNSDHVRRTDKVLTLGYPLGQFHLKSSTGIISGQEFVESMTLLQVTAPVNPGSSGGPLLNIYGHVIGITIASVLDASNVGYAIPINDFLSIVDDLYKKRFIRKPMLGLRFNVVDDVVAHYLGNPVPTGAYINDVFKGSLAQKNRIKPGDMIYSVNGYPIDGYAEVAVPWSTERITFHDLMSSFKDGEQLEIELYRAGKRIHKKILFEPSEPYPIRVMYPAYEQVEYEIIAGMVFMQLADNHLGLLLEEAPHLHYYESLEHKADPVILISYILPGSPAQQLRCLSSGDTLKEVNGVAVSTLASLRQALLVSKKSPYITVVTGTNVLAVFSCKQVLQEEKTLALDNGYTVSSTVHELYKAHTYGTKKKA